LSTRPAGYAFNIALIYFNDYPPDGYNDPSALVSGATFTVTDRAGKSLGSTTITIIGNTLLTTNEPATVANLAPLINLTLNIGGYGDSALATLARGAGTVTYAAAVGLTVVSPQPLAWTEENANVVFGPMPWPWSISMENAANSLVQLFQATTGELPSGEVL
jgi:hypothetical protein